MQSLTLRDNNMKYKIKENYLGLLKDEIVFEFHGNTYGIRSDDEALLNEECESVSREEGEYPFVIVPKRLLEVIG